LKMLNDCLSLFFPDLCRACDRILQAFENCICTHCRFHLPQTYFHLDSENPLARLFWGKVPVHAAAAYYYFQKGGAVQNLLHNLKYNGHTEVGLVLGELYGHCLMQSLAFHDVSLVLPVPLHPTKEKNRGYNQSLLFAEGLAKSMMAEVLPNNLIRKNASDTQTRKSRFERWENVNTIFGINSFSSLENRHVLIVDDVVTTGATFEACIQELLPVKGIKVSIAAIAWAW
jgi:ComF family protein